MTAVDRLKRSDCPVFAAYGEKQNHKPKASCPLLAQSRHRLMRRTCPLMMLWTAPPPARECREYGCCC